MIPLPEPREMDDARWGYDRDDLEGYGIDCAAAARRQALEEVAGVCECIAEGYRLRESQQWPEMKTDAQTGASDCEAAIRSLIDKDATSDAPGQ